MNEGSYITRRTLTTIYECWDGDCDEYPTGGAIAPFYRVDVGQQRVTATDASGRVSPILRAERLADRLLLQGGESGRAWSVLIARTGRLTGSILTEDGSFSLFGACMVP